MYKALPLLIVLFTAQHTQQKLNLFNLFKKQVSDNTVVDTTSGSLNELHDLVMQQTNTDWFTSIPDGETCINENDCIKCAHIECLCKTP